MSFKGPAVTSAVTSKFISNVWFLTVAADGGVVVRPAAVQRGLARHSVCDPRTVWIRLIPFGRSLDKVVRGEVEPDAGADPGTDGAGATAGVYPGALSKTPPLAVGRGALDDTVVLGEPAGHRIADGALQLGEQVPRYRAPMGGEVRDGDRRRRRELVAGIGSGQGGPAASFLVAGSVASRTPAERTSQTPSGP